MNISMIVAMGKNRAIGKDNNIPWKLPAEQNYFKETTMGHAVVTGRKNFESMGRALKGRRNIIITRNRQYQAENCEIITSTEELMDKFKASEEEVFIIGGEEIYRMFMPLANKLYITIIEEDFDGDTFFPEINENDWIEMSSEPGLTDTKNVYVYSYKVYDRLNRNYSLQ
jgi:dihydrofolate reductase